MEASLEDRSHMAILDQAVKNLRSVVHNNVDKVVGKEVELDLGNGVKGFGTIHYDDPDAAFSRWVLQKGGVLGSHKNDELHIMAVVTGKLAIYIGDESYKNEKPLKILEDGTAFIIDKKVKHMIVALETTDVVSITMPSVNYQEEWPKPTGKQTANGY